MLIVAVVGQVLENNYQLSSGCFTGVFKLFIQLTSYFPDTMMNGYFIFCALPLFSCHVGCFLTSWTLRNLALCFRHFQTSIASLSCSLSVLIDPPTPPPSLCLSLPVPSLPPHTFLILGLVCRTSRKSIGKPQA